MSRMPRQPGEGSPIELIDPEVADAIRGHAAANREARPIGFDLVGETRVPVEGEWRLVDGRPLRHCGAHGHREPAPILAPVYEVPPHGMTEAQYRGEEHAEIMREVERDNGMRA